MLVPFEQLPATSRLWIYASKTSFTEDQIQIAEKELSSFIAGWEAHGEALKASYKIEHGHFIILAVDESHHGASGCSIDKSVQVIRNVESEAKLDLMDRMAVFIWKEGKIFAQNVGEIKQNIEQKTITPDTQVFDNSIVTMHDYKNNWLKAAEKTWLKRYFIFIHS